MATQSFDEMMVIDTPEAARALEEAFYEAERRGPLNFDNIKKNIDELITTGRTTLEIDPVRRKKEALEEPDVLM